jgi:hypothetical protein
MPVILDQMTWDCDRGRCPPLNMRRRPGTLLAVRFREDPLARTHVEGFEFHSPGLFAKSSPSGFSVRGWQL